MAKEPVFYSFHFDNDVFRVQQVRNIGGIEDNKPVNANDWEQLKRNGNQAVQKWIDDNMRYRRCVVVLIGAETANRPWVNYEIRKAWADKKGLFGIYIHNLNCPRNGRSRQGRNPFDDLTVDGTPLSRTIKCYNPIPSNAYGDISRNIGLWVSTAIAQRK